MLSELDLLERELAYELEEELEYEGEVSPAPGAEYASIGPRDDRFHIPARRQRRPSSLLFPTNTICFLEMTARNGNRFVGSGTLIAPQVVLTAKHCLMDFPAGSGPPRCRVGRAVAPWFSSIQVTPGSGAPQADGRNLVRPAVPQSLVANSTRFRADPNLDYGAIRTATLLTIAGYPCDKPRGTMWGHSERIPLRGVTPTHLSYTIYTCPGHSGSPIWLLGNDEIRLLLGVHTSGPTSAAGPGRRCENDPILRRCRPTGAPVTPVRGENCGVRITCAVINTILGWCREFGVTGPRIDQVQYRRVCTGR